MSDLRRLVADLLELPPESPQEVLSQLKKIVNANAPRGFAVHIRAACARVLKDHANNPEIFKASYPVLLGEIDFFLYGIGSGLAQTARNIETVCNKFPAWCRAVGCDVSDAAWPPNESHREFEAHGAEFMLSLTPVSLAGVAHRMVQQVYFPENPPTLENGTPAISPPVNPPSTLEVVGNLDDLFDAMEKVSPLAVADVLSCIQKIIDHEAKPEYAAKIRAVCARLLESLSKGDLATFHADYQVLLSSVDMFVYGLREDISHITDHWRQVIDKFLDYCRAVGCTVDENKWISLGSKLDELAAAESAVGKRSIVTNPEPASTQLPQPPELPGKREAAPAAPLAESTPETMPPAVEQVPSVKIRPYREWAVYGLGLIAFLSAAAFILWDCAGRTPTANGDSLLMAVHHCLLVAFAVAVVAVVPLRLYIHRQKRASQALNSAVNPIG